MTQHVLLRSPTFVRAAKRLLKRHPTSVPDVASALSQLAADPHHPSLKSHKLTGQLKSSWACSAGYDLRIIFSFTKHASKPAILLETMGTHDEVY